MGCKREDSEIGREACADGEVKGVGQAVPEVVVSEAADHCGIVRAVFWRSEQERYFGLLAGLLQVLSEIAVAGDAAA